MIYVTTGTTTTIPTTNAILIQVNAALTGTITCAAGGNTFAVITNPTVGGKYEYSGLSGQGTITVVTSTTCDITISMLNRII